MRREPSVCSKFYKSLLLSMVSEINQEFFIVAFFKNNL